MEGDYNEFYFKKNKKGTVILLSLFLIFFTVSIIGIIYSYNKRIFQLAKQERDNYTVFKKKFDEVFTNLYITDLSKKGWNSQFFDLDLSISSQNISINDSINYIKQSESKEKPDIPKPSLIFLNNGEKLEIKIENNSKSIDTGIDTLKQERLNFFNGFNSQQAKNIIKDKIQQLLGNNAKIEKIEIKTTPSFYDKNTQFINVSYEVEATINTKTNSEKKFSITLQYKVEAPIEANASAEGKYDRYEWVAQGNIYNHYYTYTLEGTLSLKTSIKLEGGKISKLKK